MKLLLAISGGIDSTALLDAFARGRLNKLVVEQSRDGRSSTATMHKLTLVHFHHGTPHGQKAEKFVRKLAAKYDLPLELGSTKKKLKSEAEFREVRYEFLFAAKKKLAADWIVLAHHADDQAETVLFNLIRGSGLAGLAGMPEKRGALWRPLINVPKSKIEQYAKKHKLKWLDDPTNRNPKFARNRLRNSVLPELGQINPQVGAALLRTAEQARAAQDFLQISAIDWLKKNTLNLTPSPACPVGRFTAGTSIPLAKFAALPSALAKTILRELHLKKFGHAQRLEEKHFAEILTLATNPAGNKQKKLGKLVFQTGKHGNERVLTWN
jgi:tRNA(Ile)-lysidine synthase